MEELEAICQCQAGDLAALGVLFELHNKAVFRTAYAIVRNYDLAEDITQEVFFDLPAAINRFDQQGPFPPWLHTIVVRKSLKALGRGRDRYVSIEDVIELPSEDPSPEEEAEQSEFDAAIWKALGALKPKHRAALVLRYYHGFSEAKMVEILRCRPGVVKSRLHYARKRLREFLPPTDPGLANPMPVPPLPTGPRSANQCSPGTVG